MIKGMAESILDDRHRLVKGIADAQMQGWETGQKHHVKFVEGLLTEERRPAWSLDRQNILKVACFLQHAAEACEALSQEQCQAPFSDVVLHGLRKNDCMLQLWCHLRKQLTLTTLDVTSRYYHHLVAQLPWAENEHWPPYVAVLLAETLLVAAYGTPIRRLARNKAGRGWAGAEVTAQGKVKLHYLDLSKSAHRATAAGAIAAAARMNWKEGKQP